ncbi:hypothetical protein ACPA54_33460 [Uniformispora flossi]|uniref:hypothetical protein n=1 Tax=Uniformispora flossi TaxID=3390723 RepID=UPI003C2CDFEB
MQPNPLYPEPNYPPQPPNPQPRPGGIRRILGKSWVRYTLVGVIAFGIGVAAGGGSKKDDDKQNAAAEAPQPTVTVTVTVTAPPPKDAPAPATSQAPAPAAPATSTAPATSAAPAKATIPGDGTYTVGDDIQPGTYKSTGNNGCYYARLKDTSGDFGAIITNNISDGSVTVTISKSDGAFQSRGCKEWTKTG